MLLTLPKVFERRVLAQISSFFYNFLSKQQCCFWEGFSTQQCILTLIEEMYTSHWLWKKIWCFIDRLFKAFDCLDHKLLIAKLNTYGFSLPALKLVLDYLSNRKQRTYSSWLEIVFGVPQGCILGLFLFNIFLAD